LGIFQSLDGCRSGVFRRRRGGALGLRLGGGLFRGRWRRLVAFAEARLEGVPELHVLMDRLGAADQRFFGLDVVGIGDAAVNRAHSGARFVIMKADAFGAEQRVDHVELFALRDRVVGTLGLASAAVDTLARYHRGHAATPLVGIFFLERERFILVENEARCKLAAL